MLWRLPVGRGDRWGVLHLNVDLDLTDDGYDGGHRMMRIAVAAIVAIAIASVIQPRRLSRCLRLRRW